MNKVIVIGNSGVGKSTIVDRYVRGRFNPHLDSTIGSCFHRLTEGKKSLDVWDTAGQERFRSLMNLYLRDSSIVVIVYDCTDYYSLLSLGDYWVPLVERHLPQANIVLVQNKIDLQSNPDARSSGHLPYPTFQTSAKTGEGIDQLFDHLFGLTPETPLVTLTKKVITPWVKKPRNCCVLGR